jgi:hypothetical protein
MLDLKSLQDQQDWFLQSGAQQGRVDLSKIVDTHYAEAAVGKLGRYK